MALEEKKIFFRVFFFSEHDIRMLLFIFRLRNRPSIKQVRNWGNGGVTSKMYAGVHMERGVEKSVVRYVRTKWMTPNKFCGIFFVHWFGQAHSSITANKKNVVVFFRHNYNYFIYVIIRIQSPSSIFKSPQKTCIRFSYTKKFRNKCLLKIPL